ncbi:hypothetical protein [Aneurinibacillus thermoaerophilus]|uniref:hypothetical protein n=1 Tax=Aneurinibacillus thermoaerophilus TaxID=143495 RepID=UPI002E21A87E|nr:hypothetical protein [Aneurinibacillus thermoaerophilus]MED0681271.1 hypothetical protein [Aneurinibacillus thermoaerophilus]MED0736264.1 hypothetical protein [Aneurinibacillus thermoaerophilus]MED0766343.1 hypothetical protein [Aneurinibacillus thermoaerophilus]
MKLERHEIINIQTIAALEMQIRILSDIVADYENLHPDELDLGRKRAYEHAIERMKHCLRIAKGEMVGAVVRIS